MKRKGTETRQEIVDQACQLFSLKGYHHTSVNDLLAATGLTKGGLYGHFRSKEEIWEAAYDRAVEVWRGIVFQGVGEIEDPLERIARVIENDLRNYVEARVFEGGCFFFNLLVELSGQTQGMAERILHGFEGFSRVVARWLEEARKAGKLRPEAEPREISAFIVVALNGATALYVPRRDTKILEQTIRQLRQYLESWRA